MTPAASIAWHDGPRAELRELFDLADDSHAQVEGYLELGRVLVARGSAGEAVGHLQLIAAAEPGALEIKSLAVLPSFRRRGIGRRLIGRSVAIARTEGALALTLTTAAADIDNLRFYQRCGFRAVAVEPDAFTPEKGYAPGLRVDGIPLRDAIRFAFDLGAAETTG